MTSIRESTHTPTNNTRTTKPMTKKQAIKVLKEHNEGSITFNSISDRIQIRQALEACYRLLSKPAKQNPMITRSAISPKCRKCKVRTCQNYGELGGFSVQCKTCNAAQSKKRREAAKLRISVDSAGKGIEYP